MSQYTPLHAVHLELGATMAPFGGWDMPLWYRAGAIREHLAVITAAGLFDTSHMDVVILEGAAVRDFLNAAFTRDIAPLRPERCAYGAFLDRRGHCLDDGLVYPLDGDRFGIVLNASMGQTIVNHLAALPGADAIRIDAVSPRLAKLDIQGPESPRLLLSLLADVDDVLASFPYFSFKGDFDLARSNLRLADGTPLLLSRSGYTGEMGFELFIPEDAAVAVWNAIMDAGREIGLLPCGLAARDSLRAGAVLPLSHQDIGDWQFINHPWPFALPIGADGNFTKPFVGGDALDPATAKHTLPFAGFDPRRVDGHDGVVLHAGEPVGRILSIVSDVAIGRVDGVIKSIASPGLPPDWKPRGLACGFVLLDHTLPAGAEITLQDSRRSLRAEIVADIRPDRTARRKIAPVRD